MIINLLEGNPLNIKVNRTFDWKKFRKHFRELRRILGDDKKGVIEKREAAIGVVRLCRAGIAFLAAKKDLVGVQAILDDFDLWSDLILRVNEPVDIDIICVPEVEKDLVIATVGELITSTKIIKFTPDFEPTKNAYQISVAIGHDYGGELNLNLLDLYYNGNLRKNHTEGTNNDA